jgi:hypothetical protein
MKAPVKCVRYQGLTQPKYRHLGRHRSVVSVKLYYIPKPPTFKDTQWAWDDAASFDGINGFEEHSVVTAAMYLKQKKEDDYGFYSQRKAELEQRIADMAMNDLR